MTLKRLNKPKSKNGCNDMGFVPKYASFITRSPKYALTNFKAYSSTLFSYIRYKVSSSI